MMVAQVLGISPPYAVHGVNVRRMGAALRQGNDQGNLFAAERRWAAKKWKPRLQDPLPTAMTT